MQSPSEIGNGPDAIASADSAHGLNQLPDDFKSFLKYIAKREDERARREEERAAKLEHLLVESSNAQISSLQRAIIEAIKPPPSLDPQTRFWNAYRTVSEEHDNGFRAKYNGDLDTSLIFAGLFSAVNSAFIIQIQSNLQQDPQTVIQALLLVLIERVENSTLSGPDLVIPEWNGPPPGVIAVESILYLSFFSTLLVALLAVLGKQWLAYYAGVGMGGTIQQRGIERHVKFEGFRRWGFEYVMEALPVLLHISLLLFGTAVTIYMWTLQRAIAGIIFGLSLVGVVVYLFFVFSHVFAADSPFRTPLSFGLLKIPWVRNGSRSVAKLCNNIPSSYRKYLHSRKEQLQDLEGVVPLSHRRRRQPLFGEEVMGNSDEYGCLAALWMLDTSTEPDIVAVSASMVVELQWSPNIDFISPLTRLRDTFVGCFEGSPRLRLRESARHHATACGQAYCHLYAIHRSTRDLSNPRNCEADFPKEFFGQIGDRVMGPSSAELNFIYSHLREELPDTRYSSFSPSFYKWALHIAPYHFYFNPPPVYSFSYSPGIPGLIQPSDPGIFDRTSFTNSLLYMGGYLGFPMNSRDLIVVNKSNYCEKGLEDLLQYLAKCDKEFWFSSKVSEVLETIMILLRRIDHPLDLSYIRNMGWIHTLCKTLPKESRPDAAFHALQLISTFKRDSSEDDIRKQRPETSQNEEWVTEVSEMAYKRLTEFDVNGKWEDHVVQAIEDYLRVLIEVPQFGRCHPPRQFLHIISRSMALGGDGRKNLRHLAYSVIWLAGNDWFGDDNLRPVLQELDIFSRIGAVAQMDPRSYGSSYMQIIAKLSEIHEWVSTIKYGLYDLISIFQWSIRVFKLEQLGHESEVLEHDLVLALRNVMASREEGPDKVETLNTSALALMAMEDVWKDFDFSARIAIKAFCPLAKCTLSLIYDDVGYLSAKAAEEPFTTRLGGAIQHARSSLFLRRPQNQVTGMEQEEIDAIDGILNKLTEIEEYLRRGSIFDDNGDSEQRKRWRQEYWGIRDHIGKFKVSLEGLLTRSRCYLGTV